MSFAEPISPAGHHHSIRHSLVAGHHFVEHSKKSKVTRASSLNIGQQSDCGSAPNSRKGSALHAHEESGDFRERARRLADRLADEHESVVRQLHVENASLRKHCRRSSGTSSNNSKDYLHCNTWSAVDNIVVPAADRRQGRSGTWSHAVNDVDAAKEGTSAPAICRAASASPSRSPAPSSHCSPTRSGAASPDSKSPDLASPPHDDSEQKNAVQTCAEQTCAEQSPADPDRPNENDEHEQPENDERESLLSDVDAPLPGCIAESDEKESEDGPDDSDEKIEAVVELAKDEVHLKSAGLQDFIKPANLAEEVVLQEEDASSLRSSMDLRSSMEIAEKHARIVSISSQSSACETPLFSSDQEEFVLRDYWRQALRSTEYAQMARTLVYEENDDRALEMNVEDDDFDGFLKKFVSFPSSTHRVIWDFFGMLLIAYDVIVIPLEAFKPGSSIFTDLMNWVTLLFWTSDMFASFLVGYVDKGVTVLHPYKIAKHYFQTWFFVDVIVVGSDWAFILVNASGSNVGSLGRLLKILRAIRTLRLVRLLKLKKILDFVNDYIDSQHVMIAVSVCRLVFMLIMCSHFIACSWYLVGDSTRASGRPNWINSFASAPQTVSYRYFTALHWSLTQFTPASIEVQPQNVSERIFAIVVLIFALITFSSFLSTITSSMTQLHAMREDTQKQFWLLRRFLRERQVPKVLAMRIQRYVEYAFENQNNTVQEGKVEMLSLLTDQLRGELRSATTERHLNTHALFQLINNASNVLIQRLSLHAIDWRLLADSDSVFFAGEAANFMYHVVTGELQYIKGFDPRWIYKGEWICEPVLWTEWTHLGELRSFTECDLIHIDATLFGETVKRNPMMQRLVMTYAHSYVRKLNGYDARLLSDVEDDMNGNEEHMDKLSKRMTIDCSGVLSSSRATSDPRISLKRGASATAEDRASEDGVISATPSMLSGHSGIFSITSIESLEKVPECDAIKSRSSLTGRGSASPRQGSAPQQGVRVSVVPTHNSVNRQPPRNSVMTGHSCKQRGSLIASGRGAGT